ncbi:MAG TPA: PadR family transcriptional regulator [Gemmatimonadaceae bacterium]
MPKRQERDRVPEDELPLTPATFQILLALADGERHGYAIMREVRERGEGSVRLGPGTLYGSLKRLLESGLVEESDERADPELDDERRRYYRITSHGLAVARAEARRLDTLVRAARARKLIGVRPA